MSAEPRSTTTGDAWTKWQHHSVDGRFALRRCLGESDRAAVFLTEHKAKSPAEAAIKLVRADAPQAKALLLRWQAAMALPHPHLIQLFEVGRWQVEGNEFLFVVMEYGEQTLAEILRRRALSAEEVQELLPPILDALTFLHRRALVHGRLRPSNLLAVGDQLKVASDTLRPAGRMDPGTSTAGDVWSLGATLFEALTKRAPTASDPLFDAAALPVGLPASLVDTMRRCLSPMPADRPTVIELRAEYKLTAPPAERLPASEPPVQQLSREAASPQQLSRDAASPQPISTASREAAPPQPSPNTSRASAPSRLTPGTARETALPQSALGASRDADPPRSVPGASRDADSSQSAPGTSRNADPPQSALGTSRNADPPQSALGTSRGADPPPSAPKENVLFAAIGVLLLLLAIGIGLRSADKPQPPLQADVAPALAPVTSPAPAKIHPTKPRRSPPASSWPEHSASSPAPSSAALHEVLPNVPEKIRNKIQGRVHVTVRVLVDPSGNVIGVLMENAGPSKYFTRLSDEAARQWQFAAADTEASRVWLLRFQFTRNGTTVRTIEQ